MKWKELLRDEAESTYQAAEGLMDLVDAGKLGWKPEPKSDFRSTAPRFLNPVFLKIFSSEIHVLRRANFPFGLSICCIARKPPLSAQSPEG